MTVIFDLDGTLVDTLGDLAAATNHALSVCGYPLHTRDEYRYLVGRGVRRLMEGALPKDARSEENIVRTRALFDTYYGEHFLDDSRPYDGIPEALDVLRESGVTLAVLSNKPDTFAGRMVPALLGDRFAVVFGQREGVPLKPDPAAVREVLRLCGARADEAVYVGDSDVDILTGHNASLSAVGCAWGFRGEAELRAAGANAVVFTPGEMARVILGMKRT